MKTIGVIVQEWFERTNFFDTGCECHSCGVTSTSTRVREDGNGEPECDECYIRNCDVEHWEDPEVPPRGA